MSDRRPDEGPDSPGAAVAAAEGHLRRGEPLLAYNEAQSGLARWPDHVRLRQLQGLALARSGDVGRANELLGRLAAEGHGDAETLGMLARTHKDLALAAGDPERRAAHLEAGFGLYSRAFESARRDGSGAGAFYAGINAATMAVLRGDLEGGRRIAREVRGICLQEAAGEDDSSRYWREATLGEAALILGEIDVAAGHYERADALAGNRVGDKSTTRRQARLLAACLPGDAAAAVADALRIAPVLVYTGNMIDAPGRGAARFPASLEAPVREAIREAVRRIGPVAAYGSAACGADLLVLEAVRELGGETHVVLPFPAAEFRRASVDFAAADWGGRFERALAAADSVTIASDHRASGSAATFEYANLILTGMGRLRAGVLDAELRALVAADAEAAGLPGGAASLASLWKRRGLAVEQVNIAKLRPGAATAALQAAPGAAPPEGVAGSPVARHEIRALLFADAVGYSQLNEDQIPRYISGFLGAVAELGRHTAHRFEHVETSGDGLYMVFASVADAAGFGLELSALATGFDRQAHGLPPGFNLRIALHCGPVHCARDPITGLPMYTGPHTSRAARIEPITPPGQVYASSAFAAVAAASGAEGLDMRYVGRIPLAKGYGTLGLYHLRPAH